MALKGHEVFFGNDAEGGNAICHKREFRCIFVSCKDRGNNDQEDFVKSIGEPSSQSQFCRRLAMGTYGALTGKWT
jgi:hypothetical protein